MSVHAVRWFTLHRRLPLDLLRLQGKRVSFILVAMIVGLLSLCQKIVGLVPGRAAERQIVEPRSGGIHVFQRVDFARQSGADRTEQQGRRQQCCSDLHLTLHGVGRSARTERKRVESICLLSRMQTAVFFRSFSSGASLVTPGIW